MLCQRCASTADKGALGEQIPALAYTRFSLKLHSSCSCHFPVTIHFDNYLLTH